MFTEKCETETTQNQIIFRKTKKQVVYKIIKSNELSAKATFTLVSLFKTLN